MPLNRPAILLNEFCVQARPFLSETLRGMHAFDGSQDCGQLYLIRDGAVRVRHEGVHRSIQRPSLLLFARPIAHRLYANRRKGAQILCAHVRFERGGGDPLAAALPPGLIVPLSELGENASILALLFEEAQSQRCGRDALMERLLEATLLQALRHLMPEAPPIEALTAGLRDPHLRKVLVAMHEHPTRPWSEGELAERAGLSPRELAKRFSETVGFSPETHLQRLRIFLDWYSRASAAEDFFLDDIERLLSSDVPNVHCEPPVLFVGSSSIRLWSTLREDMAPLPVLNRGFGGAHFSHVVKFIDRLVLDARPTRIVLYAGDNDLDERTGKVAEDVVACFRTFASRVQASLPTTHIYYVSIKPSPLRYCDWPRQREANRQIAALCKTSSRLTYIDVASAMFCAEDTPARELFRFDGLHLSEKGYALWTRIIRTRLMADEAAQIVPLCRA